MAVFNSNFKFSDTEFQALFNMRKNKKFRYSTHGKYPILNRNAKVEQIK